MILRALPVLALALACALPAQAQTVRGGRDVVTRAPLPNVGAESDWYMDFASGRVYGPKAFGQWPATPTSYIPPSIGAACDGATTDTTAAFTQAATTALYAVPTLALTPLTSYCKTTFAQASLPLSLLSFFGSGRIMDNAGNLRGPIYTTITSQPAQLANYSTNVQQFWNADYSKVPFAIEVNATSPAFGASPPASYQVLPQTIPIVTRSNISAGMNGLTTGTGQRTGWTPEYHQFNNSSPGGDVSSSFFYGFVTGTKPGCTQFGCNAAITGPAGQLTAGADGTWMEPYGDLTCASGAFDASCLAVINGQRDTATGNLNTNWSLIRLQSTGATAIDAFASFKGPATSGIDMTGLDSTEVSVLSLPTISAGGSGYAVGDLVDMAGGTCHQTPRFIVKTLSGSAIATLGIERRGICSVWPGNPATLTTITGAGSGATATITKAQPAALTLSASQAIYLNSFNDANAWASGLPSTTVPGSTYIQYNPGSAAILAVNNGGIAFQAAKTAFTLPSTVALTAQGAQLAAIRRITSGTSDTAAASDYTIVWRSAAGGAKTQNIPGCVSAIGGQIYVIKGEANNEAANNIVVTPASGTIEGAATLSITTNRGGMTIQCDSGSTDWIRIGTT